MAWEQLLLLNSLLENPSMKDEIINSIKQGVDYLVTYQQKDGSFISLSSPNPNNFDKALKFHSVFSTALILGCLNNLENSHSIKLIKKKCAAFLLSQKSPDWSFNYWVRNSKEAKTMPYPDDLDDTFCALSALYQYDANLFDGTVMAKIVTLLTAVESQQGGPYYTWLVDDKAPKIWRDLDLAVNSNIAFFLSLQDISLPNLTKFIASKVTRTNLSSPYYPNLYPIAYFISRLFKERGKYRALLQEMLLKKQKNGIWENPLYTALVVSALLLFGTPSKKLTPAIEYLISQQSTKGAWSASAFCLDPAIKREVYYSGSSALTTAFCVEALQKYLDVSIKHHVSAQGNLIKKDNSIYRIIIKRITSRLAALDKDLKAQAVDSLDNTLNRDNKIQVALLPYYFKLALKVRKEQVSDELIIQLGMANLYGWLSYTIYDDFLDDEGDHKKLPVANLCLRELTKIFASILPETEFDKFFNKVMDILENANTWEVSFCRVKISNGMILLKDFKIPDYSNLDKLAERSLGHSLTPVAVLYQLGFNANSQEVKSLLEFFKHYLIARQLNDDAHDWEKDLKMGHVNSVGALLLTKGGIRKDCKFSQLLPKLQELFWYEVIKEVCGKILKHTQIAREYFRGCCEVFDTSLSEKLLGKYEQAAKLALEEREDAIKFLSNYKSD